MMIPKQLILSGIICVSAAILIRYIHQQRLEGARGRLRRYATTEILSGSREFSAPISTLTVDEDTGFIFISGLVVDDLLAVDLEGIKGDAEREAAAVLTAVAGLLRSVGASIQDDVTYALVHLASMDDMDGLNRAFGEYYSPGKGPTRTTVQASSIILGCKVEITVTARRPPNAPALPPEGLLRLPASPPSGEDGPAGEGGVSHLRRYGTADVDFHSPISTVTVDTESGLILLSGIVSDDIVPPPPGKGDAGREMENILEMAKGLLAAVGAGFEDVVYALVHFADLEKDFQDVNAVWSKHFQQPDGPARTAVHASKIVLDSKVEVTLTALLPHVDGSRASLPNAASLRARQTGEAAIGTKSNTIRRFSPTSISFRAPISSVIVDEVSGSIFIAGLAFENVANRPADGKGDAESEARAILFAVQDILGRLGSSMQLVSSSIVHVQSIERDFDGLNKAFAEFFTPGTGPARTTVEASEIVRGCRVEITITAVRDRDAPALPDGYVV